MRALLIERYLDAGLIQFGWFKYRDQLRPFSCRLDMLASYPHLLFRSALVLVRMIGEASISHLLTTATCVPLGTAATLELALPLVYQQNEKGVDLVGAYDIGHPSALVLDVMDRAHPPTNLIAHARRVGLSIDTLYCLLDLGNGENRLDVHIRGAFTLREVIDCASELNLLPSGHADVVREWIEKS